MEGLLLIIAVLLPVAAGFMVLWLPWINQKRENRCTFVGAMMILECILVGLVALDGERTAISVEPCRVGIRREAGWGRQHPPRGLRHARAVMCGSAGSAYPATGDGRGIGGGNVRIQAGENLGRWRVRKPRPDGLGHLARLSRRNKSWRWRLGCHASPPRVANLLVPMAWRTAVRFRRLGL